MLQLQITDAGMDALVDAEGGGTDAIVISSLGLTSTPFDVAPTLTALPGEFKQIETLSGEAAAANIIHVVAYDTSADIYDVTGLGFYLEDGTLFAVYSSDTAVLSKAAVAFGLMAFDVVFSNDVSAAIEFTGSLFNYPPATEETRGVVELATLVEAAAGVDALRALSPASAKAAVLGWMLTQDGAGCGLDSDLLDGQHGAWYADIVGRLGYTPLNAAAYTAADILAKLITVDGAGSGTDADLLDGQQGSYYADIAGRLGFTPFDAAAFAVTTNGNGTCISIQIGADNWKLQFGTALSGSNGAAAGTFPVEFGDAASIKIVATKQDAEPVSADGNDISAKATSATTFQIGHDDVGNIACNWIAIGK